MLSIWREGLAPVIAALSLSLSAPCLAYFGQTSIGGETPQPFSSLSAGQTYPQPIGPMLRTYSLCLEKVRAHFGAEPNGYEPQALRAALPKIREMCATERAAQMTAAKEALRATHSRATSSLDSYFDGAYQEMEHMQLWVAEQNEKAAVRNSRRAKLVDTYGRCVLVKLAADKGYNSEASDVRLEATRDAIHACASMRSPADGEPHLHDLYDRVDRALERLADMSPRYRSPLSLDLLAHYMPID